VEQRSQTAVRPQRQWLEASDLQWRLVILDRQAWTVLGLAGLAAGLLLLAGLSDVAGAGAVGWAAAPVMVGGAVVYGLAQRSMRRIQGRLGALRSRRQSPV
jgi:hypothetical protein